jgi:heme/copper-type cytochrome/quinol oxidase subunit 2
MANRNRNTWTIVALVVAAVVLSGLLGFYFNNITSTSQKVQPNTVNLDIMPDWGGSGYDAFVLAGNVNGNVPTPATNTTGPGVNDNNITISTGSTIQFVITSTDTAILANFTNKVSTPFVLYNDTNSGQAAMRYNQGQFVTNLPVGHTFTIKSLGLNIPIPPVTIVTFSYTFSTPGVYVYECETPCGPGMGLAGYMSGFIIVK